MAEQYRKQANFVTGIKFSQISATNQPDPFHYFYYLLHLEMKKYRNISEGKDSVHESDREAWELDRQTTADTDIMHCVSVADTSWMPRETCLYRQHVKSSQQVVLGRLAVLEGTQERIVDELIGIKELLSDEASDRLR